MQVIAAKKSAVRTVQCNIPSAIFPLLHWLYWYMPMIRATTGIQSRYNAGKNKYINQFTGHKRSPAPAIYNILTVCFIRILIRNEHDDNNGRYKNKNGRKISHCFPGFGKRKRIAKQCFHYLPGCALFMSVVIFW